MINKNIIKLEKDVDIWIKPGFKHPAHKVQAFFAGETSCTRYKPLYENKAFDVLLQQTPKGHISLTLSFCPAKVLFGNNLFEVKKQDFELLLYTTCDMLEQEGWIVDPELLRLHPLCGVDYAKIWASLYNSKQVIKLVNDVENHRRLTKGHTLYSNGGQCSIMQYAKRRLYIYDKTTELLAAGHISPELADHIKQSLYTFFRWEYNMRSAKEIDRELKKQRIHIPNTFENLFDEQIGQKILTYYISGITERMQKIALDELQNTYYKLAQQKDIHGPQKSLSWLGYHLGMERWGQQGLKDMLLISSNPSEVSRTLHNYQKQDFPVDETVKNICLEMTNALTDMCPIQGTLPDLKILSQNCGVFPVPCPRNTAGEEAHA